LASGSEEKKYCSAVRMRPMKLSDVEKVYAIELRSYPTPWPKKCFLDELTRNRYSHYVVAMNRREEIVGYAGMWIIKGEAHITNVAVSPEYRRQRVADRMLVGQIEYALARRATTIYLEVRRYNIAAQRLYSRFRFVPMRVRKSYYRDNGEDAIELRVKDTSDPRFLSALRNRKSEIAAMTKPEFGQISPVVR